MKNVKLTFDGVERIVAFPNVSQLIDIESLKLTYTNQSYNELVRGNLTSQSFVLDLADTLAYFSVLIPDLKTLLDVKSLTSLDSFKAKALVKVFKTQFLPWYLPLQKELYNLDDESTTTEEQKS